MRNLSKLNQPITFKNSILKGNFIIDENNDCKKAINETNFKSFQLSIKSDKLNYSIPIKPNGEFIAFTQEGNYSINLMPRSDIWTECNFPKNITVLPNSTTEFKDLLVQPLELCADLHTNVVMGRLRRCFETQNANLSIRNEGSIPAINAKVTVIFDDYFEDIKASFNPSLIQGNVWEFTIPEIKDGEKFNINFSFKVSCKAELSQLHCIKYLTDNKQACKFILPITDTLMICERNIGSFDPNDKTAFVNGIQSDVIHQTDSLIEYLIRFQNTGTDTAFNIRISDKLDYHLDWASLKILSLSHSQSYSISDGGLLEFQFNNIILPDSNIDERASNGYVMYSIKPKLSQLKFSALISNRAEIYFDFNEPITTNTAVIKLTPITKVKDIIKNTNLELQAIPNPTEQWTNIELPDHLKLKNLNIKLSNSTGSELRNYKFNGNRIRVEKKELVAGVYFLTVSDNKGIKAYTKIVFK